MMPRSHPAPGPRCRTADEGNHEPRGSTMKTRDSAMKNIGVKRENI